MSDLVPAGTWVEIERVLLRPEDRSPQLPDETRTKPYVLRMSGFLDAEARVGDEVTVTSLIGHRHLGTLRLVAPHYEHSFGRTVPELLHIGIGEDWR
ncbi:2-amino-4-oxopentanoate thiolase subunit OrtA [Arsenicicoccus dermatophilus]|uniref:2-amino-4-oxopentanoate thiolase subunit OrtA n=1 Tax=Arsenicicoccus dermatophilus TaxID=1076331 RepID=UPI003916EAF5